MKIHRHPPGALALPARPLALRFRAQLPVVTVETAYGRTGHDFLVPNLWPELAPDAGREEENAYCPPVAPVAVDAESMFWRPLCAGDAA